MKSIRLLAVALALAVVPLASQAQTTAQVHGPGKAQGGIDPVQTWQDFTASSIAVGDCGGGDKAVERKFAANLAVVTSRAIQTLQGRGAGTHAGIAAQLKAASGRIRVKVEVEIKQNSCSSPRIQALLKAHQTQARVAL